MMFVILILFVIVIVFVFVLICHFVIDDFSVLRRWLDIAFLDFDDKVIADVFEFVDEMRRDRNYHLAEIIDNVLLSKVLTSQKSIHFHIIMISFLLFSYTKSYSVLFLSLSFPLVLTHNFVVFYSNVFFVSFSWWV
jgi:hypothetical protein